MKHYEHLEKAMCNELDRLDKKYGGDVAEMSAQDVEKADILYHALKSAATYHAMKDAEGWDEDDMEESGRRGSDGRIYSGRSYPRMRSGHYPEWMPPMYPRY